MVPLPSAFCIQHPTFRTAVLLPLSPLLWAAPEPCPLCPWNLWGGLASDTVACPIFLMIEFKLYNLGRIRSFHQKFGATVLFFLTGYLIWVLERMVLFWGVLGNQRIDGMFVERNWCIFKWVFKWGIQVPVDLFTWGWAPGFQQIKIATQKRCKARRETVFLLVSGKLVFSFIVSIHFLFISLKLVSSLRTKLRLVILTIVCHQSNI